MVRPDSNSTIDTIFFADLDQLNLFVKEFTYREDPTLLITSRLESLKLIIQTMNHSITSDQFEVLELRWNEIANNSIESNEF